jgi:ankyrin repeat protein
VRAIFEFDSDAVPQVVAAGADPNASYAGKTLVELAAYHGDDKMVAALIAVGATVPCDALRVLGEIGITDWKIDGPESEKSYARAAWLLIERGASPDVSADDGRPLIETFPASAYPNLHRVLTAGGCQ